MARFDKPYTETLRGATLTVKSPEPETIFRAMATQLVELRRGSATISLDHRQRLISLLEQIPCFDNFDSGEADGECWWLRFDLDLSSSLAWPVIRKLGSLLNTRCCSRFLTVVFKPMPIEDAPDRSALSPTAPSVMRWEISSTAPGLDPNEIARWLRENLPQAVDDESAWLAEE